MAFPSPATNGQQYEAGGYVYQYNSAKRTWTKVGVAANVVTTTPSLSTNNVTSSNVTANAVSVGNVSLTGNSVSVGNTSVTANGVTVGNVTLTSNTVAVGNTSVTANGVAVGNVQLTANGITAGNVSLTTSNLSVGNTSVTANGVTVGNVSLTSNGVSVGNVSLTSNAVTVGNVSLTSNGMSVGNVSVTGNAVSVGNVSLTSNGVSVGNVALTSNGVSVGNVSLTSNGVSVGNVSLTSNGVSVGNVSVTQNAVSVGNTSISSNAITTETVTAKTISQANVTTGTNTTLTSGALTLSNSLSNTSTIITSNSITSPTFIGNLIGTVSQVQNLNNFTTSNLAEGSNLYFTNTRAVYALTAGSGLVLAPNGLILSTVSTAVVQANNQTNTVVSLNPSGGLVQANTTSGDVSIIGSGNVVLQNTIINVNITIAANGVIQSNQNAGTTSNIDSSSITFQNTISGSSTTVTSNSVTSPTFIGNLVGTVSTLSNFTTSDLNEGSNLYFTNLRSIYALTAGNGVNIAANGRITVFGAGVGGNVTSVNEQTGDVTLTTTNINEGTRLYFTNSRSIGALTAGSGIEIASNGRITANVVGGGSGPYTTDNVTEGSNLYFTNTRVVYALTAGNGVNIAANGRITVFGAGVGGNVTSVNEQTGDVTLTTTNINEGTNLYFTNTRSIGALTAGSGISIAANGRITSTATGNAGGGNVNSVNGLSGDVVLYTANIAESGNLYFTNTRAIYAFTAGNGVNIAANGRITVFGAGVGGNVTSVNELTGDVVLTSSNINEGTNLYFTNTRSIGAFTQGPGIIIASNGYIQANVSTGGGGGGNVESVNGQTGVVSLSTANIAEQGNLYFTNLRSVYALTAGSGVNIAANGRITVFGGGIGGNVTSVNEITGGDITLYTANIPEAVNLYYTNQRVYSNVIQLGYATTGQLASKADSASLTTANVSEVNNLYFTNARSVSALTAGEGIVVAPNGLIFSTVTTSVTQVNNFSNTTVVLQPSTGLTQSNTTSNTSTTLSSGALAIACTQVSVNINLAGLFQNNISLGTVSVVGTSNISIQNTFSGTSVSMQPGGGLVQTSVSSSTSTIVSSSNVALSNTATGSSITVTSDGITLANTQTGQTRTITSDFTTSSIPEGSNLYYTNQRVYANVINLGYATNSYVNTRLSSKANVSDLTTANVVELNNLYFTNLRSVYALTAGSGVNIAANGRITVFGAGIGGNVTSVNEQVGDVVLTTTQISEGTNLYFNNSRAISALTGGESVSIAANGRITASAVTDFGTFTSPSSSRFRLRRGIEYDRTSFIPLEGELIFATDSKLVYVGDGVTPGGILVSASEIYDGGVPSSTYVDVLDGGSP